MSNAICFDATTLKDYLLGKLSDEQSDAVAVHLEACLNCEATISQLDRASDTLTNGLRLPAIAAGTDSESSAAHRRSDAHVRTQLQAVLAQVQAIEPSPTLPPNAATVLRDYRLLEPLGFGGMGTVYKAVHTRLDRLVAVKLLPARRLGDEQAVSRFQREMRVIGQLSHPAIVQATDAGEVDGTHFLVMEYVEGCDLNAVAKSCGPLSIADGCELTRQAALGLEYAHQQGIVHRDIKPSNLMLDWGVGRWGEGETSRSSPHPPTSPPPNLKILDLGLALLSGEQAPVDELTTVGQLMGTLDYMAPEQLEDSHLVGPRADIYALAATLFRLLTGAAPFANAARKTPLQKLRALATQSAPPIRERRADLPEELAAIIDRALRREPSERFESMAEFAAALAPWCAGHDLAKLSSTASERAVSAVGQVFNLPALNPVSQRMSVRQSIRPSAPAGQVENLPHVPRRRPWVVGLLALVGFMALGVVIAIETNKGKLIIESVRDGIEVRVKKSGRVVEQFEVSKTSKSTKLAAGEYEIELVGEADGLKIDHQKIVLTRGDVVVAKVVEVFTDGDFADEMDEMTKPGVFRRGPNPTGLPETLTTAVEPDDEKPNPTAKSIDQFLAENRASLSESKYREAMRRQADVDFADLPLKEVVQIWQDQSQLPMWLDQTGLEEEGIATDAPVTMRLKDVRLSTAMVLTLRPLQLAFYWDDTSVAITTVAKAKAKLVNRSYPVGRSLPMVRKTVRLLNEKRTEALDAMIKAGMMPNLNQGGRGGVGGGGQSGGGGFFAVPTIESPREIDRLHFQFGGGGGVGAQQGVDGLGIPLEQTVVSYYAHLLELLTNASWQDSDGEGGTINLLGDVLFVRQTRPAHEQVEAALRLLEQAAVGPLPNSPVEIRRPDYPIEADRKLVERLSENITLDIVDQPLTDVLSLLEDKTSVPFVLDTVKLNEEAITSDSPIKVMLTELPLRAALHRILNPLQLAADIEEGLFVVTTTATVRDRLVTRVYEVRELLARGIDSQEFVASLEGGTTGPWQNIDGEEGEAMVFADRLLYVTQTRPMHDEVTAFLRDLDSQLGKQPAKKSLAKKPPVATPQPQPVVGPTNVPVAGGTPSKPPVDPKQPLYDGKSFDEWFAVLDTERSPARLCDAVEALRLLGQESQAATVAARILNLTRTVEIPPQFGNTNRPVLHNEVRRFFKSLSNEVAQQAFGEELRNGNTRSRKFLLENFSFGDKLVSEPYVSALLQVCRDSDPQVRRLAMSSLRNLPPGSKILAKYETQRLNLVRAALADTDTSIAFFAAEWMKDSESESVRVAEALARVVAKTSDPTQRTEALKFIAVMGPRAVAAAPQMSAVLLEQPVKESPKNLYGGPSAVMAIPENAWMGGVQGDGKNRTWQFMAAVALARMGKAAESELPKIQQALDASSVPLSDRKEARVAPTVDDPLFDDVASVQSDRKGISLDEAVEWPDLLRAVQDRITAGPPLDLRGADVPKLEAVLRRLLSHHQLLGMERALLMQQGRGEDDPELKSLTALQKGVASDFDLVSQLREIRRALPTPFDLKRWIANLISIYSRMVEQPDLKPINTVPGAGILADSPRVRLLEEVGETLSSDSRLEQIYLRELESKDESVAAAAKKAREKILNAK